MGDRGRRTAAIGAAREKDSVECEILRKVEKNEGIEEICI